MTVISVSKAREHLADALNRVAYGGEQVLIEKHGKAVAALIPVKLFRLLEEIQKRGDIAALRAALKASGKEGTTSHKKLKAELGID
jgi:prevent-host-death family protein